MRWLGEVWVGAFDILGQPRPPAMIDEIVEGIGTGGEFLDKMLGSFVQEKTIDPVVKNFLVAMGLQ